MQRPAFLAGQWYPADAAECRQSIERHAREGCSEQGSWRGLIGPHAGWRFSGDAAGKVYRSLAEAQQNVDLVVVFGSHRSPRGPSTIFCAEAWETPLGDLQTSQGLAERLSDQLDLDPEPVRPAHPDNAVELHLPFVKHFFAKAELLMLGLGASRTALEVGTRTGAVCREAGRQAVFIGSTDLTHYGPNYGFAPAGKGEKAVDWVRTVNDRQFIDAVIAGDAALVIDHGVAHHSACCPGAVAATLTATAAYEKTARSPVLADHYLSCDVMPGSSFVGYAGLLL